MGTRGQHPWNPDGGRVMILDLHAHSVVSDDGRAKVPAHLS